MPGFFEKNAKGAAGATSKRSANYVRGDGRYIARIDKCWIGENRKKEDLAFVGVTILHRLDPQSNHRVGEEITPIAVKQSSDYFWSELMSFVKNVTGEDMDAMSAEERVKTFTEVFEGENPLGGTFCEFVSQERIGKESGKPYTAVEFKREVLPSQIAEILSAEEIKRFFPGDSLEEQIAAEQAA